jgi:UDP-glucose 4-epimerase
MNRAQRVIVFGGAGFLGSHTADALSDAGYEVTVFDARPSPYLRSEQRGVRGDIRDAAAVEAAMAGCEIVYNFAGLADIDEARSRPLDTVRLNIEGNTVLLDVAARAGVQRYVFASSIYVYSEAGSFYRVSKQACELYIEEYQRRFGLNYTILRYGTLYGRRADERNSIHRYLKKALIERRIDCVGTGDELREYVHVSDAARASVQILHGDFANQHVILTGHHPMRFGDLLAMVREIVGDDVDIRLQPPERNASRRGESAHYSLTPYNFRPKIGRKLVSHLYLDMGQGLLDVLEEIYQRHLSTVEQAPVSIAEPIEESSVLTV